MPLGFTAKEPLTSGSQPRSHRKVLVTGAAGRIGSYFAEHGHTKYDLRLMVRESDDASKIESYGDVVVCELHELDKLKDACRGIDTIVHMAADPSPKATWDSVVQNNITGTYNVFVAAKSAGVRRVVYASSIHAVSGYPKDVQVKTSDPVNPGDLYGVSKCFGEALARYMAEQEGVSAIAIRIGAFQPEEAAEDEDAIHMMDAFVSHRDLNQLLQLCVDDEKLTFAIVNGLSDNAFKRLDLSSARELLGYRPKDDFAELNEKLRRLDLAETVSSHSVKEAGASGLRNELSR